VIWGKNVITKKKKSKEEGERVDGSSSRCNTGGKAQRGPHHFSYLRGCLKHYGDKKEGKPSGKDEKKEGSGEGGRSGSKGLGKGSFETKKKRGKKRKLKKRSKVLSGDR